MSHAPRRSGAFVLAAAALTTAALLAPAAADAAPTASARFVGTVTGSDGTHDVPVAGVSVTASPTTPAPGQAPVRAVTGADGSYGLPAVLPSAYRICFSFPTPGPSHVGPTGLLEHCHGATTPGPGTVGTPVTAVANTDTVVDEVLPRGAALRGTLTYEGNPVVGGRVTAEANSGDEAETDAYGHYLLKGLYVSAQVCGFPSSDPSDPGGTSVCANPNPTFTVGTVSTLDLALKPGGGVRGRVVDSAGHPVAGAGVGANVVTDADGRFSFGHVAPGSYVLCVQPPAGSDLLPNCTDGAGGPAYRVTADTFVTANATLQIRVTTTVVGAVTGPSAEPLAGVEVNVQGRTATTNSQGRYRITGATADPTIGACATLPTNYGGGTSKTGYLDGCGSHAVSSTGTTTVDLHLPVGAGMSGRILDDRTGKPLAGATVQTVDYGLGDGVALQGPTLTTGADGTWSVRGLDPGWNPWSVCVDGPASSPDAPFGYVASILGNGPNCTTFFDLTAGQFTKGLSYRLKPLAGVVGHVTTPSGARDVAVFTDDGGTLIAGGAYHLHPVAHYGTAATDGTVCAQGAGSYDQPLGLAIQCQDVPFKVTSAAKADFTMTVGGAIRGTISGGSRSTTVSVTFHDRQVTGSVLFDSTGRYYFYGLATGTYTVHASDPNGTSGVSTTVHVVQGSISDHVTVALH